MPDNFKKLKHRLEYTISEIVFQVSTIKTTDKGKFEIFKAIGLRRELVRKLLGIPVNSANNYSNTASFSEKKITALRNKVIEAVKIVLLELLDASDDRNYIAFFVKGVDVYELSRSKDLPRKLGVSSVIINTAFSTILTESEELFLVDYCDEDENTWYSHVIYKTKNGSILHLVDKVFFWSSDNSVSLFILSTEKVADLISSLKSKK